MKEIIAMACDHAGFELKEVVKKHLSDLGYDVKDYGTNSSESVDYPDFAHQLGHAITVNKYPGVRCALCWNTEIAHLGRQHNDCNVVSLPARFIPQETALQIVDEFLNTPFEGGRHQRRVEKISKIIK